MITTLINCHLLNIVKYELARRELMCVIMFYGSACLSSQVKFHITFRPLFSELVDVAFTGSSYRQTKLQKYQDILGGTMCKTNTWFYVCVVKDNETDPQKQHNYLLP